MSTVFTVLELIGIVSFSISGAIMAIDKENDVFGVVFISLITSFGGGIIRDILIGNIPPVVFVNYIWGIIALATSLSVFLLAAVFKKQYVKNEAFVAAVNNYVDALGLGVFVVSGAKLCLGFTHNPMIIIVMGIISGTGGSVLRDVLLREMPYVLKKRIYVVAAFSGAVLYYLLLSSGVKDVIAMPLGAILIVVIRICATVFKWNMPKAIDFDKLRNSENKNQ